MIGGLRNLALAFFVGLLIGVAGGWITSHKLSEGAIQKAEVAVLRETVSDAAKGIQQSFETDKKVEESVTAASSSVQKVRQVVAKRLKEDQIETDAQTARCSEHLDVGTVLLLNIAREGVNLDPSTLGDAESKAPSETGLSELIDNDLQVVEL